MINYKLDFAGFIPERENKNISKVSIDPLSVKFGNYQFYGHDYAFRFSFTLLGQNGQQLASGTGYSDVKVNKLLSSDVDEEWSFVVYKLFDLQDAGSERIEQIKVKLTQEDKDAILKIKDFKQNLEAAMKELQDKKGCMKDKIEETANNAKEKSEHIINKVSDKLGCACNDLNNFKDKAVTQMKNKQYTEKEFLISAGTLVAGAVLLSKLFKR